MSQLRKLKQKAQIEHNLKVKRQKFIFSLCFIFTMAVSFLMLVVCAINKAPTLTTTIISGSVWFIFDILYAFAIKNKWYILVDECSTGRVHSDYNKIEAERKKDNWQGNCFKFAISVIIFLIHLGLLFTLF